jgi:hypothetical protein
VDRVVAELEALRDERAKSMKNRPPHGTGSRPMVAGEPTTPLALPPTDDDVEIAVRPVTRAAARRARKGRGR